MCDQHKLFLAQSHAESNKLLQEAIHNERAIFWDNILITTATQAQAYIYETFITDRKNQHYIPSKCRYITQADRSEKRIGSGGATLCALVKLLKSANGDIDSLVKQKSMIMHSGGAAKRLPHSAPWGKLFTLSGSHMSDDITKPPGTVFDDLMVAMAGIPSRMSNGIIVVAADAFFRFNHTQFDIDTTNAMAFSTKAPIKIGTAHGVYLEKDGFVGEFLHKFSEQELRNKNAVSASDTVDLDIGVTYLGEDAIRALLSLVLDDNGKIDEVMIDKFANPKVNLSFYGDIIYPMAKDSTIEEFLEQEGDGPVSDELRSLRPTIFKAMHPISLNMFRLSPGTIRNMGTTAEALETLAFFRDEAELKGNTRHDSHIALISQAISKNCFIEDSYIETGAFIGENCLISGCELPKNFKMPDNTAIHCVPLKNGGWVCRFWGVYDDVKAKSTWLGMPIEKWDEDADSLWNAKLFPICGSRQEAQEWTNKFFNEKTEGFYNDWKNKKRLALSDISEIDIERILSTRGIKEDDFRTEKFASEVISGSPVEKAVSYLGTKEHALRRIKLLESKLAKGNYRNWQDEMRIYICISKAAELLGIEKDAEYFREKGFGVLRSAAVNMTPNSSNSIQAWAKDKVEVSLPARVNFAGSWSDAPPYCFEHGGTMLNAAVSMDGKLPVYVCAERTDELVVEFISLDLNVKRKYEDVPSLLMFQDNTDTFILFKTALAMTINVNNNDLREVLKKLGGGLRITSKVDIPKGSGLGTSSILTGALIDAISKLAGTNKTSAELSDDVLVAEQLMTTGGGWQDAIGGMYPGVKLTFTEAGIPQKYDVQQITLTENAKKDLNNRGFLLYSGQRRLAKSVLMRVLSDYVCNKQESIAALDELQKLSYTMAYELRRGNISTFGKLLTEHMNMMRRLDASCSNLMLDHIMTGMAPFTEGHSICGAGGGGFIYGILKRNVSLDNLRNWIEKEYGGIAIQVYTSEIVW